MTIQHSLIHRANSFSQNLWNLGIVSHKCTHFNHYHKYTVTMLKHAPSCFLHIRQHVCTQLAHFPLPTSRVMCVFLGGASRFKLWPVVVHACGLQRVMRKWGQVSAAAAIHISETLSCLNTVILFFHWVTFFCPLYPVYCCFLNCNRKVKTLQTSDYTINMWFNDSSLSHLFYSQHSKPDVWQYVNMCTTWSTIQKKRKKNCRGP